MIIWRCCGDVRGCVALVNLAHRCGVMSGAIIHGGTVMLTDAIETPLCVFFLTLQKKKKNGL